MLLLIAALQLSQPSVPATTAQELVTIYADTSISFTLYNPLLKSIPLVIPGVMNPNLSPLSRSGVTLAVGQQIFIIRNRQRELLYTVPADLAPGTEVNCAQLIENLKARTD
jgi:hypothetical protein